ncbi:MAG: divalent-cation tolerance protein CutA [Gemmatimonadota bacterium]|nr:divalent-cation tolerance protein CutA [Gemmatimonadota bacterium]
MTDGGRGISVVLITAPDTDVAERVGRVLVDEHLAACVNLVPGVTSLFRWEGSVEKEAEVLMVVKSTSDGFERLRRRVIELHPYDSPEVIELPVGGGDERYLAWVREEVRPGP